MATKTITNGLALRGVDKADPTPKYLQTQRIIIEAIRSGTLPPGRKLPATKDIGRLVNVSLITAHKALEGMVRSGWLRREAGHGTYVRDDVDAASGARRNIAVGILLEHHVNLHDYYHSVVLEALRREARTDSVEIEFFFQEGLNLRERVDQNVGAICIHPSIESQAAVERLAKTLPVVVLGGSFPGGRVAYVDSDNRRGARQALAHLLELGHRRIMVLSGPTSLTNSRDRAAGAVAELEAWDIDWEARDFLVSADSVVLDDATRDRIKGRLAGADRPTAIFAGGFYLALAVMQIVRRVGLSIPGDVSLVGFDDPPSAPLLDPPLTTVRQPLAEMAATAVRLIRQAVSDGTTVTAACTLPPEPVVRGSTAPPGVPT